MDLTPFKLDIDELVDDYAKVLCGVSFLLGNVFTCQVHVTLIVDYVICRAGASIMKLCHFDTCQSQTHKVLSVPRVILLLLLTLKFVMLLSHACLYVFAQHSLWTGTDFMFLQEELTTLTDMKRVWAAKKFSYIYEARPSSNSACFMQSLFAHAIGSFICDVFVTRLRITYSAH